MASVKENQWHEMLYSEPSIGDRCVIAMRTGVVYSWMPGVYLGNGKFIAENLIGTLAEPDYFMILSDPRATVP